MGIRNAWVLPVLAVLGMGRPASARVLVTMGDADRMGATVAHDVQRDSSLSQQLDTAMRASGIAPSRIPTLRTSIVRRLAHEASQFAASLDGQIFDSPDAAQEVVRHRLSVLRFDAVNEPTLFGAGSPLRYRVTDAEAVRLGRVLPAIWRDREGALRERLDQMASGEGLSQSDYEALRNWARSVCLEKGREAIEDIKGGAFFTPGDAELYLSYSIDSQIESIRGERLNDAQSRASFLEEAKSHMSAGDVDTSSTARSSWR